MIGEDLPDVRGVEEAARSKPTFIAALRINIFKRVRFASSAMGVFAVFAVLDVLLLPSEYPESCELLDDHRAGRPEVDSTPSTMIFGIDGELSSGEIGVSSNSVHGVSGSSGLGSTLLSKLGKLDIDDIEELDFVLVKDEVWVSAREEELARLCIS